MFSCPLPSATLVRSEGLESGCGHLSSCWGCPVSGTRGPLGAWPLDTRPWPGSRLSNTHDDTNTGSVTLQSCTRTVALVGVLAGAVNARPGWDNDALKANVSFRRRLNVRTDGRNGALVAPFPST